MATKKFFFFRRNHGGFNDEFSWDHGTTFFNIPTTYTTTQRYQISIVRYGTKRHLL